MQQLARIVGGLAILFLLAGCGTMYRGRMQGTYPAVQFDRAVYLKGACPCGTAESQGMCCTGRAIYKAGAFLTGVVDLPISAILDTLLWPYDRRHPGEAPVAPPPATPATPPPPAPAPAKAPAR